MEHAFRARELRVSSVPFTDRKAGLLSDYPGGDSRRWD
jgi:hypothetical protein